MAEQIPDPLETGWELRFTERALADLRASGARPGIPSDVRQRTKWPDIIDRFLDQRTADPRGTSPIQGMGRGDIFALHARDPLRAATWYDQRHRVCWFLATSTHDYSLFVRRQKLDELLPDTNDYALLLAERDPRWVYEHAAAGFLPLVKAATDAPLKTSTRRLGGALDTSVVLEVIAIDAEDGDLWLSFTLPAAHEPIELPTHWEFKLAATLPWITEDDFAKITRQDSFPCDAEDPTKLNYRPLRVGERVLRVPWRES